MDINEHIKNVQNVINDLRNSRAEIQKLETQVGIKDKELLDFNDKYNKLQIDSNEKFRNFQTLATTRIKSLQDDIYKKDEEINSLQTECSAQQTENTRLRQENERLNGERQKYLSVVQRQEKENKEKNRLLNDSIIALFNSWAANPQPALPPAFVYLEGEFRIRTTQDIKITNIPTKWITDKSRKYLFPNPNSFDQMTDISELYQMDDMSQLRSKLYNKIKIIEPCEISGAGFIQDRGGLRIL